MGIKESFALNDSELLLRIQLRHRLVTPHASLRRTALPMFLSNLALPLPDLQDFICRRLRLDALICQSLRPLLG